MKNSLKYILQFVLFATSIAILICSVTNTPFLQECLLFGFTVLAIVYHVLIDGSTSKLFLRVSLIFSICLLLNLVSLYNGGRIINLIYTSQVLYIIAFVFILYEIYQVTKKDFSITNYSWQAFALLALNMYVAYKVIDLIMQFEMGLKHLFYGFIVPLIKMVILSIGIIFYYGSNSVKKEKLFFLNYALVFFLLGDVFNILNFVYFTSSPLTAILVLQAGFILLGYLLLYMYCTLTERKKVEENKELDVG